MSMIRKQVFITKEQSRQLKACARAAGVSEAELIRAGIDRQLEAIEATAAWKDRLLRVAGSFEDTSHIEKVIKDNRANWNKRVEQTKRKLGSAK